MSGTASSRTFDPRLIGAVIVAAILGFIGYWLLTAFSPELSSGQNGRAHALSRSAIGYSALVEVVRQRGDDVQIGRRIAVFPVQHSQQGLLVLTLDGGFGAASLSDTLSRYPQRNVLIVVPKWFVAPHKQRRGWVQHFPGMGDDGPLQPTPSDAGETGEDAMADVPVMPTMSNGAALGPHRLLPVEGAPAQVSGFVAGRSIMLPVARHRPRAISGDRFTPVLPLGEGSLLAIWDQPAGDSADGTDDDGESGFNPDTGLYEEPTGPLPGRTIFVLSDPDILNNIGMADPARATAAVALLDALGAADEGVTFDVTMNGLGASDRSLLRLALTPPFLGLTMCLVIAGLLALWQGFVRFGPPLRELRAIAFGKAALVANSALLIVQARRLPGFADRYVAMVREAAAHGLHAPAGLAGAALDRWLDRFIDSQGRTFSELAAALERARSVNDIVAGAQALGRWRKDILRDSH